MVIEERDTIINRNFLMALRERENEPPRDKTNKITCAPSKD